MVAAGSWTGGGERVPPRSDRCGAGWSTRTTPGRERRAIDSDIHQRRRATGASVLLRAQNSGQESHNPYGFPEDDSP